MFNKFRNQFLILNMVTISVVMLTAFGIVYLSFYTNIQKANRNKLDSIAHGRGYTIKTRDEILGIYNNNPTAFGVVPTDYSTSFTMILDLNGSIREIMSLVDISDEYYVKLADTAFKKQKDYSVIKINGHEWMYRTINIVSDYKIANFYDNYLRITFLEVSDSHQVLNKLLINFLMVALLMLIAIYLISYYFAQKAVAPIINAWKKQKEFVADASHELKTPLTIINANVDALKEHKKSKNKEISKWLDYIKNESGRMNKLVSDLLYLAKTEDLDMKLENFPFALSDVTEDLINSLKPIIKEKNIELNETITKNIIYNGDETRIKQAMLVLIENAIKYVDNKGKINIILKKNNKTIEFIVENTGEGINKEDIPKVFDRFYRSDKVRTGSANSYGLGLAIAKAIIEKMNGKISVESIPFKTTKFTISLKSK